LKRTIGVYDGASIVVGSMIGSGIFIVPTRILEYCNGDMSLSLIIWVLGGIIAMLMALCYCELATLLPESGGSAAYLKVVYGDVLCFIYLWLYLLAANPQSQAVQIIALGDYISNAVKVSTGTCGPESKVLSKLIGLLITLVLLVCNITRVKLSVKIQHVYGIIFLIKLSEMQIIHRDHFFGGFLGFNSKVPTVSLAVFQSLWAYDGFDNITFITEEVKKPKKTLPMIIILSFLFVMGLYVVVNLSYFAVLNQKEMITSSAVAVSFAAKIHPMLTYAVTLGVCLSLIGSINVNLLTMGRLPFVAARLGFMPKILSMIHIQYFSPLPALLFGIILAVAMLVPSNIDILLKAALFMAWAFRSLCALGVLILRWKMKDAKRPYKVYSITALLATLFGFYSTLVPLIFRPQALYVLGVILAAVFYIVYFLMVRGHINMTGVGK
uniref:Amino acid permease/ SLC12A domain-containing protein n=1 Tax=Ciona savignyi TaxID=51511 RepID=H2YU10_CIOSA